MTPFLWGVVEGGAIGIVLAMVGLWLFWRHVRRREGW
jgi:uncharacterized membrane protein YccC